MLSWPWLPLLKSHHDVQGVQKEQPKAHLQAEVCSSKWRMEGKHVLASCLLQWQEAFFALIAH